MNNHPLKRPVTPHSILDNKLKHLQELILEQDLDAELKNLVQECRAISAPLDAYLEEQASQPSMELQNLEKATNELDWDSAFAKADTAIPLEREMLSGAVEGQFLKMLVAVSRAENILEIGSFTGYASLAMAEALPENGRLIACEFDEFTANFAREQLEKSAHGKKIQIRKGDALKTMQDLAENKQSFDFIFIDADKTGYKNYYHFIMDHGLLNSDGVICVDNTLFMGQAYISKDRNSNGEAIAEFNELVKSDQRVEQVLVPLRDGVTLIRQVK
jgi:caffeoyl-CoA O-methyltransferase